MVTLTTFRADEGDITSDPSNPTDGDTTTGLYDEATGLKVKKTYADGSSTIKTYDKFNRLETLTKARGIVTTYAYAPLTGELVSVSHSCLLYTSQAFGPQKMGIIFSLPSSGNSFHP